MEITGAVIFKESVAKTSDIIKGRSNNLSVTVTGKQKARQVVQECAIENR